MIYVEVVGIDEFWLFLLSSTFPKILKAKKFVPERFLKR